jgi:hypothetical protein
MIAGRAASAAGITPARRCVSVRRLHLAHAQPVAERLLANRAANLTGERVRNTSCRCRPAMSGRVPGRRGE